MKGQRLFVRRIEPADQQAVQTFFADFRQQCGGAAKRGLIGKLVGDLVSVLCWSDDGNDYRIDCLVVLPDYRRKRVGSSMMSVARTSALEDGKSRLITSFAPELNGFYLKCGFQPQGERLIKCLHQS